MLKEVIKLMLKVFYYAQSNQKQFQSKDSENNEK